MKSALRLTLVSTLFVFSLITTSTAWTFVLPLDFVVKKSVAKTGRTSISIDQEVTFKVGKDTLKTQENWLIEGDRNLKVSATGLEPFKENVKVNSLFNSKQKTQIIGKTKSQSPVGHDFYQRLMFVRSSDSFMQYIRELGISEKTRLSKAEGRICIAIGDSSQGDSKSPQIWIDQDDFLIRKIRMPSGTEINLSDYVKAGDDFWIAKTQTIKWAGATATIKVKSFSTKNAATITQFYPQNFEQPTELAFNEASSIAQVVEDFYKRFR
ncbi:hypothetical protein CIK05_15250 [Bdellovibrio sp. qaytius]|nr:hypothetical protein CIK05_15250 [Bdellovibrio sp. qaytius]